jgi:subtilisin family serine protease
VRGRDGQSKFIPIGRQLNAEGVRNIVRQRIASATGEYVAPVLYESGKPRLPQYRRVVTNDLVIKLLPGVSPTTIATELGAIYAGPVPYAAGMQIFRLADPTDTLLASETLKNRAGVLRVMPQLGRLRIHHAVPNDTWYSQQWHLKNTGQGGGTSGIDLNVETAWNTVKGSGVTIGIVDDGVQSSHPDLVAAVNSSLGYDFRNGDSDPSPNLVTPNFQDPLNDPFEDDHGTLVAGVAAGRGFNGAGICGVAPSASIAAVRLIGDYLTDLQEANAIAHVNDVISIKNNSWGPTDDGATLSGPDPLALAALQTAVATGRSNRGTIFIWSAGNGGDENDNANKNGYANAIQAIAVGAVDDDGVRAGYSEIGSNILVSAPAGGSFGPGIQSQEEHGRHGI